MTALREQVAALQREKAELQLLLELTSEHSDSITEELRDLTQQLQKHATQLEVSSQVGQQMTSLLNLAELLPQVSKEIQTRFGYYYVGVWLLEGLREEVVLQASSQNHAQGLLIPGASLPLDADKSIVAHVCRTGQPYHTDDVRVSDEYLGIKELPDTRSELTLPLRLGYKFLGALDIQSEHEAAFTSEDVRLLQSLADQIAIAIRNAQLYAQIVQLNAELEDKVQERTQELETAYRRLELLDRNKSDFIQVVSHELRTPLTLIRGYSQLLLRKPLVQEDETYGQLADGIVAGANRLHEIVDTMLDMVKIDSQMLTLAVERLSLAELLASLHNKLNESLLQRNLTLMIADLDPLPWIEADPVSLDKVFTHLLTNAIKYTPDGGRITVSGRFLEMPEQTGGFVEIVIRDTGIGIAPEFQELIFTKFYQTGEVSLHSSGKTKFKGGGAGLGLSIARGLVEAHGGRIWVESAGHDEEICPGSQFHVVLPVSRAGA